MVHLRKRRRTDHIGDFRTKQQWKLWQLIVDAFEEISEPNKAFWIKRMYRNFSRRFYYLTKCEWVSFLGKLNDNQAYGRYQNPKTRRYCLLIRDLAARMTK